MASLIIKEQMKTKEKILPRSGSHIARAYAVIDLGTRETGFTDSEGRPKRLREILIYWELPGSKHIFKKEKGEQPLVVKKKFTYNFGKEATLRKTLENWRGKAFTEEELNKGYDLKNILNTPALISLTENEYKGEKYMKVASVSPLAEGMHCPPLVNKAMIFSLEEFHAPIYQDLYSWQKEEIGKSDEFRDLVRQAQQRKAQATKEKLSYAV